MVNALALHCRIRRSVKKPCSNSEKVAAGFIRLLSRPAPNAAWPVVTTRARPTDTNNCRAHGRGHRIKPWGLWDVVPPILHGLLRGIDQLSGHAFPDRDHLKLMGHVF